jgi:hypothetical protein
MPDAPQPDRARKRFSSEEQRSSGLPQSFRMPAVFWGQGQPSVPPAQNVRNRQDSRHPIIRSRAGRHPASDPLRGGRRNQNHQLSVSPSSGILPASIRHPACKYPASCLQVSGFRSSSSQAAEILCPASESSTSRSSEILISRPARHPANCPCEPQGRTFAGAPCEAPASLPEGHSCIAMNCFRIYYNIQLPETGLSTTYCASPSRGCRCHLRPPPAAEPPQPFLRR